MACERAVLEDVARSEVTFVVTWSGGSRGASAGYDGKLFSGLRQLRALVDNPAIRVVIDAKGSNCDFLPRPLASWARMSRRVHCIEGPNMAAREAHTVLRFCTRFYDHLPRRAVVFLQDDPEVDHLRRAGVGTPHFLERLEEHYMERWRESKAPASSNGTDPPWELQPCPCHVDRERNIDEEHYGHWRSISWWLRTFLRRPDGALHLPPRLAWPRHAQFAVPSLAIRHRSRDFFAMNLALASLPSPHKAKRLRAPGEAERECTQWRQRRGVRSCVQTRYERHTKWANFGGYVVDLGPLPSVRGADNKPAAHGMALAEMYERLWFALFDPMLHESAPQVPECFTTEAVEAGPIRCGRACPATLNEQRRAESTQTKQHLATSPIQQRFTSWKLGRVGDSARTVTDDPAFMEGCALSDSLGLTKPANTWRFAPGKSRCLVHGCMRRARSDLPASKGGDNASITSRRNAQDECSSGPACDAASRPVLWRPHLGACTSDASAATAR